MAEVQTAIEFSLRVPVPMIFPVLFTPTQQKFKDGTTERSPTYKASFLIPNDSADLAAIKDLLVQVAHAKWPGRDLKAVPKSFWPIKSGDQLLKEEKVKQDYFKGHYLLRSKSGENMPPTLATLVKGKGSIDLNTPAIVAQYKNKFYSGVLAWGHFAFKTYTQGANEGITAYLQSVLSTGDGKAIGGSSKPSSEMFKGVMGNYTAYDPTGSNVGADEEIPF